LEICDEAIMARRGVFELADAGVTDSSSLTDFDDSCKVKNRSHSASRQSAPNSSDSFLKASTFSAVIGRDYFCSRAVAKRLKRSGETGD
jgi:hypothetical protein